MWYIGSVKQSHKVTRSQGHKVTKCDVVTSDLVTDKNEVKMNWFKRTFRTGNCRRGKREEGRETKSSLIPHPSSFNYFLFLFLAFLTGLFLLKADILQGVPVSFSSGGAQVNWATATPGVTAALPIAAGYDVYDSKDAGVTAGTDIKLTATSYSALQTSDTGTGDTPNAGGFNAGTKTNTVVTATGTNSSIILSSTGYPAGVTVKVSDIKQGCTGTLSTDTCFGSLSAWEAAKQRDLVAANEIEVAKIDGAWTAADTTSVYINGWTTDATRYIKIYTTAAEGTAASGIRINIGLKSTIRQGLNLEKILSEWRGCKSK